LLTGPLRARRMRPSQVFPGVSMHSTKHRPVARSLPAIALVLAVFVTQPVCAQTYQVLYRFSGGKDGAYPSGRLLRDSKGNLYGANQLAIYKLDSTGKLTVLYTFHGGADGSGPNGTLIRDSSGNLYGTTTQGGTGCSGLGCGVVFKLSTSRKEKVLYTFTGGADGGTPSGGLVRDSAGNLYGTTLGFGAHLVGVVFKLDSSGTESVLHNFANFPSDGALPEATLVRDEEGDLYGTTYEGGASGLGTVFKLDTTGKETVLHSFTGADGQQLYADLTLGANDTLYGTAWGGGKGGGVVFKLGTHEKVLYQFTSGTDGGNPYGGVLQASGNLYGTANRAGAAGVGVVFKLDSSGKETVLHSFAGGTDGAQPYGDLIRDAQGNLYGTTYYGGSSGCSKGCGVIFRISGAVPAGLH
jgi:uncharacterized repeat protein (TIGR03803 family)